MKRVNGILNQYARNLVSADQQDWVDYVGRAELTCNVATYLMTKWSHFVLAYGLDVFQPINLAFDKAQSTLEFKQDGKNLAKKRKQVLEVTRLL